MTNILIVDDDHTFLLSVSEGLRSHDAAFNVLTAENGKEALTALKSTSIDLVVTDIKMPEMGGFELLAYMSKYFKGIPIIVITAFGTPEIEKSLQGMNAVQYLEKPLDFNVLVDMIYDGLKAGAGGYIKGISLPSILQVIVMEKENCSLTIRSRAGEGRLYFENGALLDAATGDKVGTDAALEIVIWKDVEIEIDKKCSRCTPTIDKSLDYIIIEGHRRKDEKNIPSSEIKKKQESGMNIRLLNDAIDELKEDLGDGLLATDIFSNSDGQTIAGYKSQAKACALFNSITDNMNRALGGAGFPILGKYYILDLA
ncbi:MAG: response regulator, partial [bacterium]|nr:response regulator [bacterium]